MAKTVAKKPSSSKIAPEEGKLTWLPKKTFTLEFSVPWSQVKKTYDHVLEHFVADAKIEGFRKGKAPRSMVEKSVDKSKIYGEVVNHLLPNSYTKAIVKHNLKPAISPKIQIVSAEENQPWQFKATSCELPEVKLGDYQKIAKNALATDKIWTPDKGMPEKKTNPDKKDGKASEAEKFNLVAKALIDEIKFDLPDLLVDSERDNLLSKLLDQVQKLGLTIEQYASSAGKTVEDIKKEYQATAKNSLKLEIILQAIADEKKLTADEKEIDKMIDTAGDEKLKKKLNTPSERAYIGSVLRKRQVIDSLISL